MNSTFQPDPSLSSAHKKKHWDGHYYGPHGALKEGVFKLLSTLYSAAKSAPSRMHKVLVLVGILTCYAILRLGYKVCDHTPDQLDVLASVARRIGLRHFAIKCGELALTHKDVSFTSRMLLLAGLLRDHSLMRKKFDLRSFNCFLSLVDNLNAEAYEPPEQKIRVLRALAWYVNREDDPDPYGKEKLYFAKLALECARSLGAEDQIQEILREFPVLS